MGCKKTLIVFIVLFGLCFSVYCGESPSYGGNGGTEFSDVTVFVDPAQAELKRITIHYGRLIDSIQCEWTVGGVVKRGEKHGGGGGPNVGRVELEDGERINRIIVHSGTMIDQLTFHTSKNRVFGPYGGSGGNSSEFNCHRFVGFAGRSADMINQLKFLYADNPGK